MLALIICFLVLINKKIQGWKQAIIISLSFVICKILFTLVFIFPLLLFVILFFGKTIFN